MQYVAGYSNYYNTLQKILLIVQYITGYSNRGHSLSGGSRSYSSYERRDDHPHDVAPPRRLSSREFDGAPPMKRNRGLPPKRSSPSFSYKTRGGGGGNAPFGRH